MTKRFLQNPRDIIPNAGSEYSLPCTWTSAGVIQKNSPHSANIVSVVDHDTVTEIKAIVQNSLVSKCIGKGKDAEGISYKTIDVTRVQRIENHKLFYRYLERRQQCLNKQSTKNSIVPLNHMDELNPMLTEPKTPSSVNSVMRNDINEHYVFHGTLPENIESIATNGWNCHLCKNQGMFGKGIYCAESLTKADQYVGKH